jgi:hypothetical protein
LVPEKTSYSILLLSTRFYSSIYGKAITIQAAMSRSPDRGSPPCTEEIATPTALHGQIESSEAATDAAQQLGHSTEDASFSLAVNFRHRTSTMTEGMQAYNHGGTTQVNSTPRYLAGNAMISTDPVGYWQGLREGMENLHLGNREHHKVGICPLPLANILKIVLGSLRSRRNKH